jgi:2,4-dienoyl-CoA reductase-like NADH-dependent reductase (Old Yellow Enzyme family)
MPHLFDPTTLRGLDLPNRIVMAPMVQWRSDHEGRPNAWHLVHYGSRAVGRIGLIILEATSVERRGRLSYTDMGIWDDSHVEPLARIVDFCHSCGSRIGIQLSHAGRRAYGREKGQGPEPLVAPSAIPFRSDWPVPQVLTIEGIDKVVDAFAQGARRAREAGFDAIQIHAGHALLLSQFMTPLANKREDEYGGSHENRARITTRVIDAIRAVWPDVPIIVRISCVDWIEGGNTIEDAVEFARIFKAHGADNIDCSSARVGDFGDLIQVHSRVAPLYQVPFAEQVRREAGIPTTAVGLITDPQQAEQIVVGERADLVALARQLLREPYWPLRAAEALGAPMQWTMEYRDVTLPPRY